MPTIILGASILFGALHWSHGFLAMGGAFIINLVFFHIAITYRSVGSVLIVHYLINFYFFAIKPYMQGAFD